MSRLESVSTSSGLSLIEPVGFLEMQWLLAHCRLVMTDSGGLQKEAFFHQKPCVILRRETEWVELVEMGACRLAAASREAIVTAFNKMIAYEVDGRETVYGIGHAAESILEKLYKH